MNVLGVEIPQQTIDQAVQSFQLDRAFTARDLTLALIQLGVTRETIDGHIAYRCADRVLQKCRKAGTHTFSGGLWRCRKIKAA